MLKYTFMTGAVKKNFKKKQNWIFQFAHSSRLLSQLTHKCPYGMLPLHLSLGFKVSFSGSFGFQML